MPKARVNRINLYYQVHGQGEPLVMIQGFSGGHEGWFFQIRAFRKHYQVVVFDNRGIGKTDRPEESYTIKTMADDTVGLMDHLGIDKAHILGVSLGGRIAQEVAISYPERLRKLVLGCTFAREDEMGGHSSEYFKTLGLEEGCSADELRSAAIGKVLSGVLSLAFNDRLFRMSIVPLLKAYARLLATEGVAAQFQASVGHDTLDRLYMIEAPTLVITGTQDRLIRSTSSEAIANRIPNAKLVKVEAGSHTFFVGMRSRFNREVLDFLSDD